jgi:uncharacterized protein
VSVSFLRPLLRTSQSALVIRNSRNGRILAHDLISAFDSKSRRIGLLRHESFPEGSAMLIAPSNAVHTFFMHFPIDVVFVTRDGRVVKACPGLKPWRLAGALRAHAVVELPAGTLTRQDTVAGDVLAIEPYQPAV